MFMTSLRYVCDIIAMFVTSLQHLKLVDFHGCGSSTNLVLLPMLREYRLFHLTHVLSLQKDMTDSLTTCKPSITKDGLKKMEEFARDFGQEG